MNRLAPAIEEHQPFGLLTLEKYWQLDPAVQGYMCGLQFAIPGSELKDEANPYPLGTSDFELWSRGYGIAREKESK